MLTKHYLCELMFYKEIQPSHILSKYIKCFWILEGYDPYPSKERILPDGRIELMFHYGDLFKQNNNELSYRSFVTGQITQSIEIEPPAKTGIVGVRFLANGAEAFLQLPIHQLTNIDISTHDLFGRSGKELEEKIMCSKSNAERISILEGFLLKRLTSHKQFDFFIQDCIEKITLSHGQVSMDTLAGNYKISNRQLERKFTNLVGISPKLLSRIVRFQNVFNLVKNNQINSLSTLSYEGGYYDQAHFIRDFKEFSGLTPKQYFSNHHKLSDLFIYGS